MEVASRSGTILSPRSTSADYRGAGGSNAGGEFRGLWALQQILRLLRRATDLTAVSVEGIGYEPSQEGADRATWDGVDCASYYCGSDIQSAERVEFAQLKYSGSDPDATWTVARLCHNT